MNLQSLLNADLRTMGGWLRQGLSWWLAELADMVPAAWRAQPRAAPWRAIPRPDGTLQVWRDGRPDTAAARPGESRRVDLVLPEAAVLLRELDLPRLSGADLRRMLTVNLDRYTPFTADQVYFDTRTAAGPTAGGLHQVCLGLVQRRRADALLEQAAATGLTVERLGVEIDDGAGLFDLMPAIRAEQGSHGGSRRRVIFWSACAGLAVVNIATAIALDIRDVRRLEAAVAAEQPAVDAAGRLRARAQTERALRLDQLNRRSRNEPLRVVDAISKATPRGAWVQRLEWNGQALRVVGFMPPGLDILGALIRSRVVTNPRSLLSDIQVKTATGVQPFDVVADSTARGAK